MQRRTFLKQALTCASAHWLNTSLVSAREESQQPDSVLRRRGRHRATTPFAGQNVTAPVSFSQHTAEVMTVTGKMASTALGTMLPHEHVLVDFIGADKASPQRYDPEEVFGVMLPHLKEVRALGCRAIAECTPAYLGRDPALLRRLSEASGVTLLTNTGYYGAAGGKFLPRHVADETADELANRWSREFEQGIADTGIRPGFIKIGVDGGPLTEVNRKLVQAAARCHRRTGLTIAAHTGDGTAALAQIDVLRAEGVAPSAWVWVHAQSERNTDIHRRVAQQGAWVEFDGVGPRTLDRHVQLVAAMKRAGFIGRMLVSHDAGWYSVGEPHGGTVRSYGTLFTRLLPALKQDGFTDDELRQLTVLNPAKAFSIAERIVAAPTS